jgi:hypothetical protein
MFWRTLPLEQSLVREISLLGFMRSAYSGALSLVLLSPE